HDGYRGEDSFRPGEKYVRGVQSHAAGRHGDVVVASSAGHEHGVGPAVAVDRSRAGPAVEFEVVGRGAAIEHGLVDAGQVYGAEEGAAKADGKARIAQHVSHSIAAGDDDVVVPAAAVVVNTAEWDRVAIAQVERQEIKARIANHPDSRREGTERQISQGRGIAVLKHLQLAAVHR